eukprot:superscaffoldBa00009562_g24164
MESREEEQEEDAPRSHLEDKDTDNITTGDGQQVFDLQPGAVEDKFVSEQKSSTPTRERPAPPGSLALSGSRPKKKKVLLAPALSLSLGHSESTVSDDYSSAFLSPSPEDDEDTGLDFDLDAIETPSDSESLPFPIYDLEDDMRRLGVASGPHRASGPRSGSGPAAVDQSGPGSLEQEDQVDSRGTRWRCFSTGDPPQESRVNMSVLQPFLRVLSHGGYYGDGMNDIIVFSSCYLPESSLENYQYVMDNLFRLRKNLKGFYVVHPTWYIKALITIIKPFISRKLQFVDSLQGLSHFIPTEHVQIPDCVREYDQSLSR